MKKILLFIFLGIHALSFGQILSIEEAETGLPIELVTVANPNFSIVASSNAKGQVDIASFKNQDIIFRCMGYENTRSSYADLVKAGLKISLKTSLLTLDQVVIAGTKWTQDGKELPSRLVIVTPKEVRLINPQTAADLLTISGEVFMQKSQQGGGSPMIRGFATNRLLYSVDGVRMNTAIFRSGNLQNVISLDAFAIENTEILFGSNSVIYGSDAIGGVMNFQTLSPQFSLTDQALITGKSVMRFSSANQEHTYHFDVNLAWKKLSLLTSFTQSDFGDIRMGSHGPEEYLRNFYVLRIDSVDRVVDNANPLIQKPTDYSQFNLMQKLRYRTDKNWDFEYGFHYSQTSDYSRYDRLIRTKNGLPRSAEWNYGPQLWTLHNLSVSHSKQTLLYDKMSLRLARQYFEESRIDRDFNKSIRYIREEQVSAYSANFDFLKIINAKHKLFYGAEYVYDEVVSLGWDQDLIAETTIGSSRYPQSTWASAGAYIDYQMKVSQKFLVQVGARYNQYSIDADFTNNLTFYPLPFSTATISNGALTGTAGASYSPNDLWSIYANVSTGFRSPNIDDFGKVFDSSSGAVIVPNPDLKAEYAYNVEFGFVKMIGKAVKLDVSTYYTLLKNAMVRRDFQLNGLDSLLYQGEMSKVEAIQNAAKANVYGVQAGINVKLPLGFGFSSHLNYQHGEEELDDASTSPLRHAAPTFGNTKLSYAKGPFMMQLYAIYNGEKSFEELPQEERDKAYLYAIDANGNPYSPAWYTINLKAAYQLNKTFSIQAGVENISDQRYRPYSSGVVASGRNFVMSINANF